MTNLVSIDLHALFVLANNLCYNWLALPSLIMTINCTLIPQMERLCFFPTSLLFYLFIWNGFRFIITPLAAALLHLLPQPVHVFRFPFLSFRTFLLVCTKIQLDYFIQLTFGYCFMPKLDSVTLLIYAASSSCCLCRAPTRLC